MAKFKLKENIFSNVNQKDELVIVNLDDESEEIFILKGIEKEIFLNLKDGKSIQDTKNILEENYDFQGKPFEEFATELLNELSKLEILSK